MPVPDLPALVRPDDLRAGVPDPTVQPDGRVSGAAVLLALDQPVTGAALDQVLAALAARNAVVVGVADRPLTPAGLALARGCDTSLGRQELREVVQHEHPEAAARQLAARIEAHPRAALVLGSVLAQTEHLPLHLALAAEAAGYSTLLAGPEFAHWLTRRGPAREPAGPGGEPLSLERVDGVLHVRLTRPERRNALDAGLRAALVDALLVAGEQGWSVRLSGDGPVFCSGGDLDEFGTAADPATAWVVRTTTHPGRALAAVAPRAQVLLHGACAGAGIELAAFAGQVQARPGTTLRLPELAMGLLPGAGGTVSLPLRAGRWRTAWMALSGQPVDAPTALRWGLVDELVR